MMNSNTLPIVTIATDGACTGNPGPAGFCAILAFEGHRKVITGGYLHSTNNRAELFAVLAGLEALKFPCQVTLFTDSTYVINSADHCRELQRRHWWRHAHVPVPNWDLLERLIPLLDRHQVQFRWVQGHADDLLNNACDREAVAAAHQQQRPIDSGYGKQPPPPPEPPRLFDI